MAQYIAVQNMTLSKYVCYLACIDYKQVKGGGHGPKSQLSNDSGVDMHMVYDTKLYVYVNEFLFRKHGVMSLNSPIYFTGLCWYQLVIHLYDYHALQAVMKDPFLRGVRGGGGGVINIFGTFGHNSGVTIILLSSFAWNSCSKWGCNFEPALCMFTIQCYSVTKLSCL